MNNFHIKTALALALSFLKGIGPVFIKKNSYLFDSIEFGATKDSLYFFLESCKKSFSITEIDEAVDRSEKIIDACGGKGIKVIGVGDVDYPSLLLELKDPPPVIYCKGNLNSLKKVVTIVGTRKPNKNGEVIAERVANFFSENAWSICNGLADGIDSCAIKNTGGYFEKAVGILGGGINYEDNLTLPKNTQKNAEIVLENNGLLISESLPDAKEDTFSVIKSCRIQAGLARGLILVQSSVDGGSRFTVKAFSGLKRSLAFIYPMKQDYMLDSYSANRMLAEKSAIGLAEIADVKHDKIAINKLFAIKSRDDYVHYEQLLLSEENSGQQQFL